MAEGTTIIRANPTDAEGLSTREIAAELKAATKRTQEGEFKYCYNYGFRKIGDLLIYFRHESKQWPYPQDIELEVYCRAVEDECISFAEIKIDQGSSLKETEIIEGGIGQKYIRILIKAQNTYWLRYEVRMFGRKINTENNVE